MQVALGIQFTFNLQINLQKHVFYQYMTIFVAAIVSFLNPC